MDATQRWDASRMGPLSVESVVTFHQPSVRFRVSRAAYPAGTVFAGATRSGRTYVLAGACEYKVSGTSWELRAGDIVDLPEGEFAFRVLGNSAVEIVSVWELTGTSLGGSSDAEPAATADGRA